MSGILILFRSLTAQCVEGRRSMYKCGACGGSYSNRTMTPHAYICDEGLASALISGDRDKIKTNLFRLTSVGLELDKTGRQDRSGDTYILRSEG